MEIHVGKQYLGYSLGDANNSVLITLGDPLTGDTESSYAQLYQQVGFCSLPPNSVPGQPSAEVLTLIDGSNRQIVFGTRHVNSQALYANMNPGDSIMYGSGPDGNTKTRIKANGTTQTCSMQTVDSDNKDVQFMVSPVGLSFYFSWGKFIIDSTGMHYTHATGAQFHVGSLNAGLVPGVGFNSYARLQADLIQIPGTAVQLGKSPTFMSPVLAPLPSAAPGVLTTQPVTIPIANMGITSTCVFLGI